jgi:hypothetical protein
MGRCNNRRAQERAAQDRNTPSRARFSKGPPKKNAGRGGRGGGRDGGRGGRDGRGRGGGRAAANEAVVQKLQDRAKAQRADIGGISIVKKQTVGCSLRRKHPLDGIDVSRLDAITLAPESVAIVEKLLRAYSVWDGDDADEEKKIEYFACDDAFESAAEEFEEKTNEHFPVQENIDADVEMAENELDCHNFALLHGDDSYDDYCGDYEDEPDFQCSRDVDVPNDNYNRRGCESDVESGSGKSEKEEDGDEKLKESSLFKHLTQHYSFQPLNVVQALKASHKRISLQKQDDSKLQDKPASDEEGALLEMAMDWLSLHLKETDLRRGFIVQKSSKEAAMKSFMQTRSLQDHPGFKQTIKAVPHESISIMPKLTEMQYKKEITEATCQWKRQELGTELVRMGFHMSEIESVMSAYKDQLDAVFSIEAGSDQNGDSSALQPTLILGGAVFKRLVEQVESIQTTDWELNEEMEEASILERDQEKEVLEAIYAEDFKLLNENCDESFTYNHYQITINTTDLLSPARNDCKMHIITRDGYPLASPPSVWFANPTLPPSLLRRISINLQSKTKELIGQAAAYDVIEYLTENASAWQKEYTDEQAQIEKETSKQMVTDYLDVAEDEIDFYTTTFTAEERKNLSRRQRQKLRAAEKSHARDEILLERQREKEKNDEERRARIRIEDSTMTVRRAEQVVEQRWKEWVEDEAEKAARKAMNNAFLRDESREQARLAADAARKEVLRFHGELEEDEEPDAVEVPAVQKHVDVLIKNEATVASKLISPRDSKSNPEASPDAPKVNNGATAKTLAFTEKLRRMWEQKVAEKASGNSIKTIHLADASDTAPKKKEFTPSIHIPTPIVTSSPCMENILNEILSTHQDQPWLIQPDARVPTLATKDMRIIHEMSAKDKLSNSMRVELERKYNSGKSRRYGKGKNWSNKQFDEMLACRSKLPAYKMRHHVVEIIRNNQITVISGDTGKNRSWIVYPMATPILILLTTTHSSHTKVAERQHKRHNWC